VDLSPDALGAAHPGRGRPAEARRQASQPFPNPPVTLIPSYPDLPMEKVFVRQPRTDVPQVLLRETDL
jgi:hypothetical protein